MTMTMQKCLIAHRTVAKEDLAAIKERVASYVEQGVDEHVAEINAVSDVLAEAKAEGVEIVAALSDQHRDTLEAVGQSILKEKAVKEEQANRPRDAKGNLIYQKGERVEFVSGEANGRHGEVTEANGIRMVSIGLFGGQQREEGVDYHYTVKTDGGASFFYVGPQEIQLETARPEKTIPDIEIDGGVREPAYVLRSIAYAKQSAEKSRAAAQRARKPDMIQQHKRDAARNDEKASTYQAAFDAWAQQYPEAAAQYAPAKPISAESTAAKPQVSGDVVKAAGLTVTKTTTKNGKPVWEVGGNTKAHADLLKRIGGRWYGPKKVWSFYNDDPTKALTEKLGGQVAAPVVEAAPSIMGQPVADMSDARLQAIANSAIAADETKAKAKEELAAREEADNPVPQSRVDSIEIVEAPQTGRWLAREKTRGGYQNLATFALSDAGTPQRVDHFFESEQTRDPVRQAIERWAKSKISKTADLGQKPSASKTIAEFVRGKLNHGEAISWQELFAQADKAFGGTQAEGKYDVKSAYDAMEMGVNLWIRGNSLSISGSRINTTGTARDLTKTISLLPTQTKRTAEMDEFQQFSTPPALAYVANWVAGVKPGDVMLEPSAGTGDLVIWSEKQGASLILNELSSRRAAILKELFPDARIFTENAEQLNNVLPADAVPTVVVMNPPFSATAGRVEGKRDTMNGAKHIEQALKRLQDGGRLVAIVGEGMAHDRPAFKEWWKRIQGQYNVRANIGISGKEYAKYGTTFDNQILVIDKSGPTMNSVLTGKVESVSELPAMLEGIRNDRPAVTQRLAIEPESGKAAVLGQGNTGQADATGGRATDAVGVGSGRDQDGRGNAVGPASRLGKPDTGNGSAQTDGAPDQDGQRGRVSDRSGRAGTGRGSGDAAGGTDTVSAGAAGETGGVTVGQAERQKPEGELTESVFEQYRPQRLEVNGAKQHPGKLVQSAAMASVEPPTPTYTPNLPKEVIDNGLLSLAQIEAVVYAGQAHSEFLPNGERRGFFIGDGTGVGKGREISGIILDNMRQGRSKAVWVSYNEGLINDAQRDFSGVGGDKGLIFFQGKTKPANQITAKSGILFTSYSTLKSGEKKQANDKGQKAGRTRLDQIVEWLSEDFDGVIVFDEAHSMGNVIEMKGKRGMQKPSQQAIAGVNLQKRLPKARIVYVSATGATEIRNLGYASRLGLWGEGTAFSDVKDFIGKISGGGVAAMELISRDMKALGQYIARSLSFDGVTYRRLDHDLTDLQKDIYNELAKSWQVVLQNVHAALNLTDGAKNGGAKSAAMSAFWGAHQRFFNQIITSLQTPTVIDDMRSQIESGNAVVVQLVNTNEATQEREVAKAQAEGVDLEELDFTPRQTLMDYVSNSFPVQSYEESTDDNGNTIYKPVVDSNGNPVFDKEAIAMRDALLKNLEQIRVPENPIDAIINAFGSDKVGEVTGRKRRFIQQRDEETGSLKVVEEKRGKHASHNDATAFQNDKKPILIFSQAGGTGYSFHADMTAKNQRKRIHYILQPGWRADSAVQGFGRTHRTNQATEPEYVLPTTNLKAQKRFVSSIARRLDQLGALTRGQRQATSQGLFTASDNLESKYASDALDIFFQDLYRGKTPLDFGTISHAMGFDNLIDKKTGGLNTSNLPEIPQFLNRLLSLESGQQDDVFTEFERRLEEVVHFAIQQGTYDNGLQALKAASIKKVRDDVVYTDERTGAETRYVEVDVTNPVKYRSWAKAQDLARKHGNQFAGWYKDAKSGKVFGLIDLGERVNSKGESVNRGVIFDIRDSRKRYIENVNEIKSGKRWNHNKRAYEVFVLKIDDETAEGAWIAQVDAAPKTETKREHLIVGAILPIWDRVNGHPQIYRLQTDEGERMIGRIIGKKDVDQTLKNLGIGSSVGKLSAKDVFDKIKGGARVVLANGWDIKLVAVSNDQRIEVAGGAYLSGGNKSVLIDQGVYFERIQWNDRAFIPTNDDGIGVLERIIKSKPVVDIYDTDGGASSVFSRNTARGIHPDDLNAVVQRARKAFPGLPMHALESERQAPDGLRKDIKAAGAQGDVAGALFNGEVYLFAPALRDVVHAEKTIAHEAAHAGLRRMFGESLNPTLLEIRKSNLSVQLKAASVKAKYGYSLVRSVDEALADMGAEAPKLSGWGKLVAWVRGKLRNAGFVTEWTDGDITALLLNALDAARKPSNHITRGTAFAGAREGYTREAFASNFLKELAASEPDVFRYPTSSAATLQGVFRDVFPGVEYFGEHTREDEKSETGADHRFVFATPESKDGKKGKQFNVYTTDAGRVWIDVQHLQPGDQGSRIYHAVANYAHNARKVFGGDPVGVSPDAIIARMKMMLASILRFGTAKHLDASREQEKGIPSAGIEPLDWRGSDVEKLRNLIHTFITTATNRAPRLNDFHYDFQKRGFFDGSGKPVSRLQLLDATRAGQSGASGIGADSGRAAILIQSLVSAESRGIGDAGILQALLNDSRALVDGGLGGVFSRATQEEPVDVRDRLNRIEEVLRRKASGETITDTLIRVPMQTVGIDKATRKVGQVVRAIADKAPESVKAGVVSDYGIPEEAIDQRDAMFGHQRRQLRGVAELLERMAGMSREESRVAYEWLNNRDADHLIEALPESSRNDLMGIKQQIDALGREAVRLGLLSADAYEAHRMAYVHRSYRKWDIEATPGEQKSRARAKQILGDQFKARGLSELAKMENVKNTNPSFWQRKLKTGKADQDLRGVEFIRFERRGKQIGTGNLEGMGEDAGLGKLLEVQYWPKDEPVPERYGAWHEAGTFTVRGTQGDKLVMHRDWTKAERERMGEIDEARYAIAKTFHQMIHDIEVAKYLGWIAGKYGKTEAPHNVRVVEAREAMRATFGKDDWVQVPMATIAGTSVRKFGALAGLYIPGPLWNDIRQVVNYRYQPLGETYASILRAWKISKALALDTPIPTPSGWTTMGALKPGDTVFDEHGKPCSVLQATETQHNHQCYEVEFSDGTKIVADAGHLWYTEFRGRAGIRETREIVATLKERTRGDNNHRIPVCGALDLPEVDLPLPPYALGVWLGDGDTRSARISAGGEDVEELTALLDASGVRCGSQCKDSRNDVYTFQMKRAGFGCLRGHDASEMTEKGCRLCANAIRRARRGSEVLPSAVNQHPQVTLRELGVLGRKHIPAIYLRASEAQRMELLRGLMDTDGNITDKGFCSFTTSLPELRDGALELLRSLGYKPSCTEFQPSCNGKPGKTAWRIHFKGYADKPVFGLSRKRERLCQQPATRQRSQTRQIVAVREVPSVPVRCILVSSPSHLFLAGDGMVPTHNTALSPAVHTNNIMANFVMADWHDVRAQDVLEALAILVQQGKKPEYKDLLGRFEDSGGTQGMYILSEIQREQLEPVIEQLRAEIDRAGELQGMVGVSAALQAVMRGRIKDAYEIARATRGGRVSAAAVKKMMDVYQSEDTVFRLAAFIKAKRNGATDLEAGKAARRSFLDYQINAPWIQIMRQTAFPFISFTYRAVPMLLKTIETKPWKLAKLMLFAGLVNALGYALSGGDEDDERRYLPDEKAGRVWGIVPKLIRMPWNDAHDQPVFLDVRRWIPVGDVLDTGQTHSAVPVIPVAVPGGPLALAAELLFNKSQFTGKEIVKGTDTGVESAQAVVDHLYKAFAPNIFFLPGTYANKSVMDAGTGRTDVFGREQSVGMALASSVGVKAGAYPVDVMRRNAALQLKGDLSEIRKGMYNLGRERARGGLSDAEFNDKLRKQIEKSRARVEEFSRK